MTYRISIDTGGTFTDVVVADEAGTIRIGKALTNRERAYESIREGLAQVALELGVGVDHVQAELAGRPGGLRLAGAHEADEHERRRLTRSVLYRRHSIRSR